MMNSKRTLIVVLGPTGVGKTSLSLRLAKHLDSPILSSDSRQLYRDLPIGTAAPTAEEQAQIKHYFVGTLGLEEYYSASEFEKEALVLLEKLFPVKPTLLMTGGSMMYIDAVCKGIDDIPTIRPEVRKQVFDEYERVGLEPFLQELQELDQKHYQEVDRHNYKRVLHAIEICRQTGKTYSSFRKHTQKERPFNILKIGLKRERTELCERINKRVDIMMKEGLEAEARRVYPYCALNSLNTVGYKEMFNYFSGEWSYDLAVEKIKRNSRVYARKQMTWFKRDKEIHWFHPDEEEDIMKLVDTYIEESYSK